MQGNWQDFEAMNVNVKERMLVLIKSVSETVKVVSWVEVYIGFKIALSTGLLYLGG